MFLQHVPSVSSVLIGCEEHPATAGHHSTPYPLGYLKAHSISLHISLGPIIVCRDMINIHAWNDTWNPWNQNLQLATAELLPFDCFIWPCKEMDMRLDMIILYCFESLLGNCAIWRWSVSRGMTVSRGGPRPSFADHFGTTCKKEFQPTEV